MLKIEGNRVIADTRTLKAVFENGVLVSLIRKSDGYAFVTASAQQRSPLRLIYRGQEQVALGAESGDHVTIAPVNDTCVDIRVESWNGDGVITLSEDVQSGALHVEPSGYASRPGLRACRWTLTGINPALRLVAPFWQGVRLPLNDTLIHNSHFAWPFEWQAGLLILETPTEASGGLWLHCKDTAYRYKAVHVGSATEADCLSLDTESYGPLESSLGAGSLTWEINTFEGDWHTPAAAYRDWLAQAFHLDRQTPPAWVKDLHFAISWCPAEPAILDALAKRLNPAQVLLHIPNWRTDGYDQNYPTFQASPQGRAFVAKAQAMGFRAMPHFNAIDMDPTHPTYTILRDFQYRDVESQRLQGWTWADGQVKPLQESNATRLRHQDKNTMVKIHPGLSMWRSLLTENVRLAVDDLALQAAFLDVTLCTWNLHNCLVENMTPTEGMRLLIHKVASLKPNLCVGGEGRNEITMQAQHLSQVHLFRSSGRSIEWLERTGGCPVNEFMFGPWSRSFGYSSLSGANEDEAMRMQLHVSLGALPTITIESAREIEQPNAAVEKMLTLAQQG
jgi:hypothetical protein